MLKPAWKVRELRERRGMSREALADAAGCSVQTVMLLERSAHCPKLSTARRVAAALSVTVDELFPPVAATELVAPSSAA
jgi:DNA-binding XRE family transcriptional regulator